jgi:hypothetical protein
MSENLFKLRGKSKQLAGNRNRRDKFASIGHQLYTDGILDKERKDKLAKKAESPSSRAQDWSCAQCGTYSTVPGLSVFKHSYVCTNCGWSQEGRTPFKPINIALELMPMDVNTKGKEVHTFLHADSQLQKVKQVELLRRHRKEEEGRITFKPSISEVSEEIIRRRKGLSAVTTDMTEKDDSEYQSYGQTKRSAALGEYLQKPAADRLYATAQTWVPGKRPSDIVEQTTLSGTATDDYIDKFVDRLTYEYKDKDRRIEMTRKDVYGYDYEADQPFFQPRLNPFSRLDLVSGFSDLPGRKPNLSGLFERCNRTVERRNRVITEYYERERLERELNKAVALPQSEKILDDARRRSIDEMFRLLVATERVKQNRGNSVTLDDALMTPRVLTKLANEISDVNACKLDLNSMEEGIMVPEVGEILSGVMAIRATKSKSDRQDSATDMVSYRTFYELVNQVLNQRHGGGKTYVYAPKKQPTVTRQMISEELKAYTFKPKQAPGNSLRLRRDADIPVEDALLLQAERTKFRMEQARRAAEELARDEFSFEPTVYKPPKNVKARYREGGLKSPTRPEDRTTAAHLVKQRFGVRSNNNIDNTINKDINNNTNQGRPARAVMAAPRETAVVLSPNPSMALSPKPSAAVADGGMPPSSIQFQSFTPFSKHVIRGGGSATTDRASPSSSYSTNMFYHPTLEPPSLDVTEGQPTESVADVNAISPARAVNIDFDDEVHSDDARSATADLDGETSTHVVGVVRTKDKELLNSPSAPGRTVTFSENVESPKEGESGGDGPWYEEGQWHGGIDTQPDSDDESSGSAVEA